MTKKTKLANKEVTPEPSQTPESAPGDKLTAKDVQQVRTIERIIENREIAPQDAFGKLSRPQIDLLKRTIAKGASDDELTMFIQVCKGANLNPFLKQVHLVPRWDSKEGRETRAIQVSIDGFRAVAESSGKYAGQDDVVFGEEKEIEFSNKAGKHKLSVPTTAQVTVYKIVEGQRYPFPATARWSEYYPGEKMGFQWHIRPFLMLGKCAEALALRKAFPKLLSGMYAQEEMDRTSTVDSDAKKQQTGLESLMSALNKSTNPAELEDYKTKMQESPKYTEAQKKEFFVAVDARIKELTTKKVITDADIPIIQQ